MTNQSTIDKLIEMRLTTMADALRNQLADSKFREVPFEDRFGMLAVSYTHLDVYKRQVIYVLLQSEIPVHHNTRN